jgi:hypothetical protein
MQKRNILATTMWLLLTATIASPQVQPTPVPARHHHRVLGAIMVAGGVGLMALGTVAFTKPCPAQDRAQQISSFFGIQVTAGQCGSSWMEKNKNVIGGSAMGSGAALVVSGVFVMRQSEKTAKPAVGVVK